MEVTSLFCIFCGTNIPYRDTVNSWQRDFRAIRCDNHSALDGRPFLTGVGGYLPRHIPFFAAPSDPGARWDDKGFALSTDDAFPPLIGQRLHPQPGFVFHDACWEILLRMLYPYPVPIERLYDICLSCPASRKGWLDWGHSYGGLMDRFPVDGYPWEDVHVVAFVRRYLRDRDSPLLFSKSNPLDVYEIQQAVLESRDRKGQSSTNTISITFREGPDCFRKLPQEILEYIQTLLPSSSVTNARLASSSFATLPLNPAFWASRFESHQDRGFCIEAKNPLFSPISEQRRRDWKELYEKTALTSTSSREMKNRKRVCDCLRDIVDLLLEQPLTDASLRKFLQAPQEIGLRDTAWRSVGGDFASRTLGLAPSGMPCRAIYEQVISLAFGIKHMAVSFRTFTGACYISGLRFVPEQGQDILVGYVVPSKETVIDFGGQRNELTGFIAAVGPRGIMALRTVTSRGEISDWIGSPDGFPQTVRLCLKDPIHTLRVVCDGFKLVSLSVPSSMQPLFPDDTTGEHIPLRTTGLWYPDIPASFLHLHDDTFAGRNVSFGEYRPLVHVMFGGTRGTLLKYLSRISVTVSNAAIVGIDFFYVGGAPVEHMQACRSTASADDSVKIPFSIDGPGGELLTGFQGDGDFFLSAAGCGSYKYGAITSLKVTTNFGRAFVFQPSALPILKLPVGPYVRQRTKRTELIPGTTLTGIYLMHDPKCGMISVGPISEDLNSDEIPLCAGIEYEISAQLRRQS